mgnify:CR=1 FL=1
MKEWLKIPLYLVRSRKVRNTAAPISLRTLFLQKIVGINSEAYWPTHFTSVVSDPQNILIGVGTAPGLSPGCYIQGKGKVVIGDYTIIAPNVGIISANHSVNDHRYHVNGKIEIGKYCWLGMNAVILPNVILGDHTIVAANSVVTKSFPDGYSVLAGSPARIIKALNREDMIDFENENKFIGYIPMEKFERFRKRDLNV